MIIPIITATIAATTLGRLTSTIFFIPSTISPVSTEHIESRKKAVDIVNLIPPLT